MTLPAGYNLVYGGEADRRQEAVGRLMASVGVLGTMMIATLVLSFGSFRLAGVIVFVGAMAVGLALLAIELFGFPFGFIAIVATMGLVGVAINDTIVVLSSIHNDPEARSGNTGRIAEIVVHETRHVLATTLTTMAGFSPLMLGGGDFWPPLAVAIGGGVIGATLLALVFVPSLYVVLCRGFRPKPVVEHGKHGGDKDRRADVRSKSRKVDGTRSMHGSGATAHSWP